MYHDPAKDLVVMGKDLGEWRYNHQDLFCNGKKITKVKEI